MKEIRSKITVIKGDITKEETDALVNAANSTAVYIFASFLVLHGVTPRGMRL